MQQRELELDSSRAAIGTAEDGVRSALETQRVLGERYRAGVATSTDVLDAEVALLQAELERTRARRKRTTRHRATRTGNRPMNAIEVSGLTRRFGAFTAVDRRVVRRPHR